MDGTRPPTVAMRTTWSPGSLRSIHPALSPGSATGRFRVPGGHSCAAPCKVRSASVRASCGAGLPVTRRKARPGVACVRRGASVARAWSGRGRTTTAPAARRTARPWACSPGGRTPTQGAPASRRPRATDTPATGPCWGVRRRRRHPRAGRPHPGRRPPRAVLVDGERRLIRRHRTPLAGRLPGGGQPDQAHANGECITLPSRPVRTAAPEAARAG